MIRSCVVCRSKQNAATLIRFQINSQKILQLHLKKSNGRSAWVCPTPNCLGLLNSKPKIAARALRQSFEIQVPILLQVKEFRLGQIKNLIHGSHRNGKVLCFETISAQKPAGAVLQIIPPQELSKGCTPGLSSFEIDPLIVLNRVQKPNLSTVQIICLKDVHTDLLLRYLREYSEMR